MCLQPSRASGTRTAAFRDVSPCPRGARTGVPEMPRTGENRRLDRKKIQPRGAKLSSRGGVQERFRRNSGRNSCGTTRRTGGRDKREAEENQLRNPARQPAGQADGTTGQGEEKTQERSLWWTGGGGTYRATVSQFNDMSLGSAFLREGYA